MPEEQARRYILDAKGDPVPEPNFKLWVRWCQLAHDQGLFTVAEDLIEGSWTVYEVRTVFLASDRGHRGQTVLFQTHIAAVRGPALEARSQGYASRQEAVVGHNDALFYVRQRQGEVEGTRGG